MNLNHLQTVDGPIGRCYTLISEDGERTFAINEGHMNKLRPDSIPEEVFDKASALVVSSYLMRGKPEDLCHKRCNVPLKSQKHAAFLWFSP